MPAMTAAAASAHTPPVTKEHVKDYVDHGFLVYGSLISAKEIEELKEDLVKLARGGYPCRSLQPMSPDLTDRQVTEQLLCIHQPHFISPVIRKFVMHPEICAVLSKIVAAHLPHWDGSVKCMQSMLFVKPPGLQGQAWHQDEIYIPTRDRSLCGAWIAIDDATIENGCLRVLPGSHRSGYLYPMKPHGQTDEFDGADSSHGFSEDGEMPVEVRAGSVVFFNGYLLHRSKKNRGSNYRRALVNHYMNSWSLLPLGFGKDFPDESIARADNRCVVNVTGADPYGWKGRTSGDDVWLRTYDREKVR